jgi:hypothetical protein
MGVQRTASARQLASTSERSALMLTQINHGLYECLAHCDGACWAFLFVVFEL